MYSFSTASAARWFVSTARISVGTSGSGLSAADTVVAEAAPIGVGEDTAAVAGAARPTGGPSLCPYPVMQSAAHPTRGSIAIPILRRPHAIHPFYGTIAPMDLYAATTNPGKLRDFAHAAAPPVRIQPLPGLAAIPAPPEDGPTFDANARLKAVYYSHRAPGLLVLADDSGLEVAALDNAPGVRSARYAA